MSIKDVRTRLEDILKGRGADGSLGPAAQARACTVELFRVTSTPDLLTIDASAFDRTCHITIDSLRDDTRNVQCNQYDLRATVTIVIGYAASAELWEIVHGEANEAAKRAAVAQWKSRAFDDLIMIDRAMTWYELTGNDTQPVIERLVPDGDAVTADSNNGRAILTRRYELRMEANQP